MLLVSLPADSDDRLALQIYKKAFKATKFFEFAKSIVLS